MATLHTTDQFEQYVDSVVYSVLEGGATSFHQILLALPSVDPSTTLYSLQRLAATGRLAVQFLEAVHSEAQQPYTAPARNKRPTLPIPHPLDYEWRFTHEGIGTLLQQCLQFSEPQDKVAMLGVPSVFEAALGKHSYDRRLVLIDSNVSATQILGKMASPHEVMHCDLVHGHVPGVTARVAVIDAPWYPPIMEAFLWAASKICSLGGHTLMSVPPPGTRPNITGEWECMLQNATRAGFHLVSYIPCALPYVSPPFERNALRVAGITNYPANWRRGDLAVFVHSELKMVNPPEPPQQSDTWSEYSWPGVRIRLRHTTDEEITDPTLVSIIPGDILPSVSQRDIRRQLADVWTSGNRIFRCENTRLLGAILSALVKNEDPNEFIPLIGQRPLSEQEVVLVRQAQDQVQQLIYVERNETLWCED